jgi:hypothetical protein
LQGNAEANQKANAAPSDVRDLVTIEGKATRSGGPILLRRTTRARREAEDILCKAGAVAVAALAAANSKARRGRAAM